MNCIFTNPVYWDSATQRLLPLNSEITKFHNWAFSEMACTSTPELIAEKYNFTIEHTTTTAGDFLIEKKYTYGDITLTLAVGFLTLIMLYYVIRRLFTHSEIAIHTIHKKIF